MKAIHKKFLTGGVLLAIAVGYLGVASVKSGWVYYVEVDRFVDQAAYHSQRVKLCGTVAAEGLTANPAALSASFTLRGQGKSVPVDYHGVIPDTFAAGREVVVEGKLNAAGIFQADQMMTKCASKYEAGKTHPAGIQRSGNEPDHRNP
jgi:cytochrome c-type biogenesis protein CcmE